MSHSVQAHLDVTPAAYDAAIRRFIPHYEEMLARAGEAVARLAPPEARILDLGGGTGALSEHLATRLPLAALTLLDSDPAMLERARARLSALAARVTFVQSSFFEPLPGCDVAAASLSLHHVRDLDEKQRLYRNIRAALPAGGLLVNADVTLSTSPEVAEMTRAEWAAHLVSQGDTEAEAYARFAAWAGEDLYFSAAEELDALRAAGFSHADVLWRRGPSTVLLARV